jgi:hypothetical protein
MVKSSKAQRFREKMRIAAKQPKQGTLDNISKIAKKEASRSTHLDPKKLILITEISPETREDELKLKVGFRLHPSRIAFSKITAELFFDTKKMSPIRINILAGPLAADTSEFSSTLDMTGISAGLHTIKVEMYEPWSSGEKLTCTSKEATIEYTPTRREDRWIEIPIVKHMAGANLQIVSDSEKNVYRELQESMKKDEISKRDEW